VNITQVKVISETNGDHMICWVSSQIYKIKKGMRLSFSDYSDEEIWVIAEVYSTGDYLDLNRKWNVGGL